MWSSLFGRGLTSGVRKSTSVGLGVLVAGVGIGISSSQGKFEAQGAKKEVAPTGSVFSWGSNQFGQLGLGDVPDQFTPQPIDTELDSGVSLISSFGQSSAIVSRSGKVYTFGRSIYGSIGQGDSVANCFVPVRVPELDDAGITSISMGEYHFAALGKDGTLWTAGRNWAGELGRAGDTTVPEKVDTDRRFKAVSCGRTFTAAVDTEGDLFTWGNGNQGALGVGELESRPRPTKVNLGGAKAIDVSCGQESTLILADDGSVFSCGNTDYGKLGLGDTASVRVVETPRKIESLAGEKIKAISNGDYHATAITEDGRLFTWGRGQNGCLGHHDKVDLSIPTQVKALDGQKIEQVSAGGSHTAVITSDKQLYLFGSGRNGQLGTGDDMWSVAAYRTTPHQVHSFSRQNVTQVAAGADH
eukprot:CAMPEP_0203751482 /NCGR_PEP_ID=MMETSP0098-20131031/5546_1 /ASSEMBLY_ACC=CAM_ASM_000208 /TAXON_ID=96639 /ORGANISM=" , Strain NY0313808BC1" /LENGTH=413 /DNA_ID=CAMNT_0050641217 /DNA_START=227 /DNA_END=1465 /DNA_ORIENTATION=-